MFLELHIITTGVMSGGGNMEELVTGRRHCKRKSDGNRARQSVSQPHVMYLSECLNLSSNFFFISSAGSCITHSFFSRRAMRGATAMTTVLECNERLHTR